MKPRTIVRIRRIVQFLFFAAFVTFVAGAVCAFNIKGASVFTCTLGTLQVIIAAQSLTTALVISGLVMVVLTILVGRVFCSWICPFGAIIDWLEQLIKRIHLKRADKAKSNALINPKTKYGVLLGTLIAAGVARSPVFCAICPIGNTCRASGMQGVAFGIESLLIPLFAGLSFIKERFWCRYLCPVGAVLALTDKISFLRVKLPADTCVRCKRCENSCPMNVQPWSKTHKELKEDPAVIAALVENGTPDILYRPIPFKTLAPEVQEVITGKKSFSKIPGGECIRCFECAASCPLLNESKVAAVTIAEEQSISA